MDIALISSRQDPAGANIRDHVLDLLDAGAAEDGGPSRRWMPVEVAGRLIEQDRIDRGLKADLIVFLSRHRSEHPRPVLTVHATGNFQAAALGGRAGELAPAAPAWMHAVLRNLDRMAPEGYRVSYEVTHHGPTDLHIPSFFVEIGSTEAEWADPAAGSAVARSVLAAAPVQAVPLLGFGGNHYAARESGIALTTRGAFGHIAHSREAGSLDRALVCQMVKKSGAVAAYLDRKALSTPEQRRIRDLLQDLAVPEVGEGELLELKDLAWESYLRIRACGEKLSPGSRCHPHALPEHGEPGVVSLPPALVAEALRADESGFLLELDRLPVVHLTASSGRILPKFITYRDYQSELINDLISLCVKLISGCANTVVEGDRLVIRRVRFDTRKARDFGVPEGPLFGMLSEGKAVEVDGRTITPAMVQTCSVTEIHIPGLARYL